MSVGSITTTLIETRAVCSTSPLKPAEFVRRAQASKCGHCQLYQNVEPERATAALFLNQPRVALGSRVSSKTTTWVAELIRWFSSRDSAVGAIAVEPENQLV